jgi:hypothetical protein
VTRRRLLCPPALASFAAVIAAAPCAAAQWQQPGLPVPQVSPPSADEIRTIQILDQAKRDDAGRRLEWVWIDAQGGFEQLGMQLFSGGQSFVGGYIPTSSSGGTVSLAAGARLLFLTVVLRGRVGVFDSGQLWRVGPEVGFHVPLGRVEPHVELSASYAAMDNLHDSIGGAAGSAITLRGFGARAGTGVDFYVAPTVSLGIDASAELLGLFRAALSGDQVAAIQQKANNTGTPALLSQSASAWGGTVAITAVFGLHF